MAGADTLRVLPQRWLNAWVGGLLAAGLLWFGIGCKPEALHEVSSPLGRPDASLDLKTPQIPSVTGPEPVFITADFLDVYRFFVPRQFTEQEKALRWSRYYEGRWVHWTGLLRYTTGKSLLFQQLGASPSYEVSLQVPEPLRSRLVRELRLGRYYHYAGRIKGYETTFRAISLDQGLVFSPSDLGVPGVLTNMSWTRDPPPIPTLEKRVPDYR